ncbi:MAG: phosphatase PAP2 family protein [Ruminococcus sp.]
MLPYGDSKTAATGYSFPSGHTTRATAMFGGSGLWFMEKKHSVVAGLLFVLVFLTMFSRNYLGVHTPAGCSGGIYINSSYDVSDRVVGIVE